MSFETNEQISMVSIPEQFQKATKDHSLNLNLTDFNGEAFVNGQFIQLNVSLSYFMPGFCGSYSAAHDIDVFIYYDSSFLELQSVLLIGQDRHTLAPSSNTTKQGLIQFHTDVFGLFNNQLVTVALKMKTPTKLLKGEQCSGAFIVDFRYLSELNGTVDSALGRILSYKCKIDQWKDISLKSTHIDIPQFSMIYNDLSGDFFFCLRRTKYSSRNSPICYTQKEPSMSWHALPTIAAVLSVDVTAKVLYGLDRVGVYVRASDPFEEFHQIEDGEWAKVERKSSLRRSVKVHHLSSLPVQPKSSMTLSASGNEVWTATRSGVFRKTGRVWELRVVY